MKCSQASFDRHMAGGYEWSRPSCETPRTFALCTNHDNAIFEMQESEDVRHKHPNTT